MTFESFGQNLRCVVVGSSGGIGAAMVDALVESEQVSRIHALSRTGRSHPSPKVANLTFDFTDEDSLIAAAQALQEVKPFDIVIVATGLLQGDGISPEKNLRALSHDGFAKSFEINTVGPAMTAKYFVPLLRRDEKAVFAALSARVGSISDNRLGGWYAYRASKAALNMVLKTLAIEIGRRFKNQIIIGLHPGTVDTDLSKPFQGNVPEGKLFTPEFSAESLLKVVDGLSADDSGNLFDWAGKQVDF
jgi:NAD(P)-dependent dehydrogenase (short-subunit alcohol dehydrogenase family)